MKVILCMAPTPNGMIAKPNGDSSFVSVNDWRVFVRQVKKARNVVVGRHTFEICVKEKVFPIANQLNVVMTKSSIKNKWGKNAVFLNKSPKEILRFLSSRGFKTVVVAGGGMVNASFIKDRLIDELLFDVQPKVFGKGIRLFEGQDFDADLKLIGTKRLSKNEVQLRYKVLKK